MPADHKWFRNLVVARIVAAMPEAMDPQRPDTDPDVAGFAVEELGVQPESVSSSR